MDKVRNVFRSGGSKDDELMYGQGDPQNPHNLGKISGEGSHFGPRHGYTDSGVGGISSPSTAADPTSGLTGSSATRTADAGYGSSDVPPGTTGQREFPLTNTTGTGSTTAPESRAGVAGTEYTSTGRETTGSSGAGYGSSGRDAALGTGAGVAGYEAGRQYDNTSGSYGTGHGALQSGTATHQAISSANAQQIYEPAIPGDDKCKDTLHGGSHHTRIARVLDPCYDTTEGGPNPGTAIPATVAFRSAPGATGTGPTSTTGSTGTAGHHTGRDAALGASAGAAAYEAGRAYDTSSGTTHDPMSSATGTGEHSRHHKHHERQEHAKEHHHGRDAALAGGVGTAAYEAEQHHGRQHEPTTQTTAGMTGASPLTGTIGTGEHSRHQKHHDRQEHAKEHHTGRDTALAAGAGTAVYEAEKHHHNKHQTTDPTTASTTTGTTGTTREMAGTTGANEPLVALGSDKPVSHDVNHSLIDKLDPRVNAGKPGFEGSAKAAELGADMRGVDPYSSQAVDPRIDSGSSKHHTGRDATLAGTAGAAAYEAEKHHGHNQPTSSSTTTGNTTTANTTSAGTTGNNQHHYGRDATLAGGVGAAGYEAEKHHSRHHEPATQTTAGMTGASPLTGTTGNSTGTVGQQRTLDPMEDQRGDKHAHHYGRDTALAGGAGAAAYEADKHLGHQHQQGTSRVGATGTGSTGTATTGIADIPDNRLDTQQQQHHYGRDAAIAGGAGAAAYEGEREFSKVEAEKRAHEAAKQRERDEKAATKEEKAEKPGLLSRILHRGSKSEKDRPAEVTGERHPESSHKHEAEAGAAGVGAAGLARHEHNKLQKDPPAGYQGAGARENVPLPKGSDVVPGTRYGTGHDEKAFHSSGTAEPRYTEVPTSGYATHVTGGTGTTALAEGGLEGQLPRAAPQYAEPPRKGYASQVTGGTGTTALQMGEPKASTHEQGYASQVSGGGLGPMTSSHEQGYASQVTGEMDPKTTTHEQGYASQAGTNEGPGSQGVGVPASGVGAALGGAVHPNLR